MTDVKHTPGPWILGGCSGRMITTPSSYMGDGFIADVDMLENAHLIAAAPDLLWALKGFMSLGVSRYKTGFTETDKELDVLFSEGAKAIAKAKGGAA